MGHYDAAYEIDKTGDISDATRLRFEQMRGETRTLQEWTEELEKTEKKTPTQNDDEDFEDRTAVDEAMSSIHHAILLCNYLPIDVAGRRYAIDHLLEAYASLTRE